MSAWPGAIGWIDAAYWTAVGWRVRLAKTSSKNAAVSGWMHASDLGWTRALSRPTSFARTASTYRSTNACCSGVSAGFWAKASPMPYSRHATISSDSRRITPIIADAALALRGRSASGPIGDEDRDGEAVADLRSVAPGGDPEAVVGERGGEQLADPVGVTRLGERAAEQAFELAFQAVVGYSRLRPPHGPEKP